MKAMSTFLTLALLASLTGGGNPAPSASSASALPLALTNWQLTQMVSETGVIHPDPSLRATLRLEGGKVSGFSGCNRYMGRASWQAQRLKVGHLAGTLMACTDPKVGEQELQFLNLLGQVQLYQVSGRTLVLFGKGQQRLIFTSQASAPVTTPATANRPMTPATDHSVGGDKMTSDLTLPGLVGQWRIVGLRLGSQPVALTSPGKLQLHVEGGLRLSGSAGCNQLSAVGQLAGQTLTFGPVAATRMLCQNMQPETALTKVLAQPLTVLVVSSAGRMVWRNATGEIELERADTP